MKRTITLLTVAVALSGCNAVVLNPSGDIAAQQRDLVLWSTVLMLIVIIPVMVLTVLFAWRYRKSNAAARYEPNWDHSLQLELIIWAVPLLIIICLGALTWVATHLLDPYRPIDRVAANKTLPAHVKPLVVDVVALDWKWLFIYPEFGVGTLNELAAPVDRPLEFRITASSVMNSFYIPALAGQIYAMPGMTTQLHAVINHEGVYQGFSANYSGAGFSGMHFAFRAMTDDAFRHYIEALRNAGAGTNGTLGRPEYLELEKPSENEAVRRYSTVDPKLFDAIVNRCVKAGTHCMSEMMR